MKDDDVTADIKMEVVQFIELPVSIYVSTSRTENQNYYGVTVPF